MATDLKLASLVSLDHRRFREAEKWISERGEAYLEQAMRDVSAALIRAYGHEARFPCNGFPRRFGARI